MTGEHCCVRALLKLKLSDNAFHRFVYRRMFVADGNFKADHVRNERAIGDIWLSEGGLMDPVEADYRAHLKNAADILTVGLPRHMHDL